MLELTVYIILSLTAVAGFYIITRLNYAFNNFHIKKFVSGPAMLSELPSVSVCIPARNETHAMTSCLELVINSSYPKLEIIVLDDSSVDDTSILIKSFAHAGVRFVEGPKLKDGWLGKNNALQGLLREASGTYVLFMDVDTHIKPDTIEQLVSYMTSKNIAMLSVMPNREDSWRFGVLLTPLRYFFELILHSKKSPAVASNAWMIDRRTFINDYDGFNNIADYIQPEKAMAEKLMPSGKYRFLMSNKYMGVSFEKKWSSQVETGVRLDYSILGGRLLTNLLAVIGLLALNLPMLIIISTYFASWNTLSLFALFVEIIFVAIYALYLHKVRSRRWILGALLWPIVVFQELAIVCISIYRNISGTVTWKGRPVVANLRNK